MTNVSIKAMRENLTANFAAREEFEAKKGKAASIMPQLDRHFAYDNKAQDSKWGNDVFKALRDAGVSNFDFITHKLPESDMFNIKGLAKVGAHIESIARGKLTQFDKTNQKYCGAIVHELIQNRDKFERGEMQIKTGQFVPMFARAARNDSLATYDFATSLISVQPSTASTQASSSMRALDAMGVVNAYETGTGKDKTLHVNYVKWDHPLVALFAELYGLDVPKTEQA